MHIKTLQLKNFKRFTELTLDLSGLQQPPKLVLMIGTNGSGKSSVFDAFEYVARPFKKKQGIQLNFQTSSSEPYDEEEYFRKQSLDSVEIGLSFVDGQNISFKDSKLEGTLKPTDLYGRSALRQMPTLTNQRGRSVDPVTDPDRPKKYIERDQRFQNDIDSFPRKILEDVFSGAKFNEQLLQDKYVDPLNNSFRRIFGNDPATALTLERLIPSLNEQAPDIHFRKGNSTIHYDFLSSGEKEVFNILLNLFNRREHYTDTIYFIDELDVHLNTALQYAFLKEITENWIPDSCQLWTASHSLGFIQYAQESEDAAILDFDQYDFDQPRTIIPQLKESLDVYEIAVPHDILPILFQDKKIVFCENKDVELYQLLGLDEIVFVPAKDKTDVYFKAKGNPGYLGLMDRDYLTSQEIEKIRKNLPNLYVLGYYAIENYLYHPENLKELLDDFDTDAYIAEISQQNQQGKLSVVYRLKSSRDSYKVLRDEDLTDKDGGDQIIASIKSDNFADFYPYTDMKTIVDRTVLMKYNLSKAKLASTEWFRNRIAAIFDAS